MNFDDLGEEPLENLDLKQTVVPTGGERLPDRSALELVRNPISGNVELLHSKDGEFAITTDVVWGGKQYVPSNDATHLKHLPSGASSYLSTRDLLEEVQSFIVVGLNVSSDAAALLTNFCVASFFADVLGTCPLLILLGDSMGAVSLLRLLGYITYHAVLLADCGNHSAACDLRPTRLILQADARVDRLLAPLQFPGFATSNRGLRQISGAVALYVGEFELRSQHREAALSFPVTPTLRFFSPQDELRDAAKITELRNQLLQYRLQNLNAVMSSNFDVPTLSGPTRVVARMFGQCIVDAPDRQGRIVKLLQAREEESRVDRSSGLDAIITEALVALCHEQRSSVHLGQVAEVANGMWEKV